MNESVLSKLFLLGDPPTPPQSIIEAYRGLSPKFQGKSVPWHLCLPKRLLGAFNDALEKHRRIIEELDTGYVTEVYEPTEKVFDYLRPAKINLERYEQFKELDTSGHILSFQPDNNGYAQAVRYDRTATLTGRLKTTHGPMLLHLPKIYRSVLESRWGNKGRVISLDYKSLEPRLLLACCGTQPRESNQRDIYLEVKRRLFKDNDLVTREVVKKVVLSELYGAGESSLREKLAGIDNADEIIKSINVWFGVEELKEKLCSEWVMNNQVYVTNFYGRRIKTDTAHTLVNHYIQSTAVDVCLLGFLNILEYLDESLGRLDEVVPLFLLVDALILDVHENCFGLISGLGKLGAVDIKKLENTTFYMSADKEFVA